MKRESKVKYLSPPMYLIGVGEIGHYILRAMEHRKAFPIALFLSDPDVIAAENPSFALNPPGNRAIGQNKATAMIPLLSQYYKVVSLVVEIPKRLVDHHAYVYPYPFPPSYSPNQQDVLIVECTDDAKMLALPAVHIHTGLVDDRPGCEIWYGSQTNVQRLPHPPAYCRQALSEAARHVAEVFVEMLVSLDDWRHIRNYRYSHVLTQTK